MRSGPSSTMAEHRPVEDRAAARPARAWPKLLDVLLGKPRQRRVTRFHDADPDTFCPGCYQSEGNAHVHDWAQPIPVEQPQVAQRPTPPAVTAVREEPTYAPTIVVGEVIRSSIVEPGRPEVAAGKRVPDPFGVGDSDDALAAWRAARARAAAERKSA
jgi:hypothetical protein